MEISITQDTAEVITAAMSRVFSNFLIFYYYFFVLYFQSLSVMGLRFTISQS